MKAARIAALSALVAPAAPAPGSASVPHTVEPGETLWGIAAANGMSADSLAAANGLSSDANVIEGNPNRPPPAGGSPPPPPPPPPPSGTPEPMGGYTVQPGETLSGIAPRSGVSPNQ